MHPGDCDLAAQEIPCKSPSRSAARSRRRPTATVIGLDLNPHMLAVARASASREGVAVEWREGRVEQLPFPDRSFDLVLCQAGLMFFADRPAALTEMRRVLIDAGRLYASVSQGLDRHPFYQTLHETIQKRLGMSGFSEIFALGDSDGFCYLCPRSGPIFCLTAFRSRSKRCSSRHARHVRNALRGATRS